MLSNVIALSRWNRRWPQLLQHRCQDSGAIRDENKRQARRRRHPSGVMNARSLAHNQGGHLYGRRDIYCLIPLDLLSLLTHPQLQHALPRASPISKLALRDTRDYRAYGLRCPHLHLCAGWNNPSRTVQGVSMRFGEFCSCCCLPPLPQLASSILATWGRPYRI